MSGGTAIRSLGPLQAVGTHQTACGHGDCQKVLEMELWERKSEFGVSPALQPWEMCWGTEPTFCFNYLGFFCRG